MQGPSGAGHLFLAVSVGEHEAHRGVELCLLDRLRRIDAFGAHHRALADEAALPDALGVRDHRQAFLDALVARIEIVAAGKRDRRRAEKLVVQAVDGAGRVTEHAVDAFAELAELIDLLHRLAMLAGTERVLLLPDDPRFDGLQLVHEVLHVDDEVANDREVLERLDSDGSGPVVAEEGVAGELRGSVDHHPAAPADAHPARPPIAEAAVNVRLDVVERVQDHHALVRERNVIRLEARCLVLFGIEARGPDRDPLFRHQYVLACGLKLPIRTSRYSSLGRGPSARNASVCFSHFASSRSGKSRREWAPRDSSRASAEYTIVSATSSMKSSSSAAVSSVLKVRLESSILIFSNRSRSEPSCRVRFSRPSRVRKTPAPTSMSCCISSRMVPMRSSPPFLSRKDDSIRRLSSARRASTGFVPTAAATLAYSAAARPDAAPNTRHSESELEPSRLPPLRPTFAHSPAA